MTCKSCQTEFCSKCLVLYTVLRRSGEKAHLSTCPNHPSQRPAPDPAFVNNMAANMNNGARLAPGHTLPTLRWPEHNAAPDLEWFNARLHAAEGTNGAINQTTNQPTGQSPPRRRTSNFPSLAPIELPGTANGLPPLRSILENPPPTSRPLNMSFSRPSTANNDTNQSALDASASRTEIGQIGSARSPASRTRALFHEVINLEDTVSGPKDPKTTLIVEMAC